MKPAMIHVKKKKIVNQKNYFLCKLFLIVSQIIFFNFYSIISGPTISKNLDQCLLMTASRSIRNKQILQKNVK